MLTFTYQHKFYNFTLGLSINFLTLDLGENISPVVDKSSSSPSNIELLVESTALVRTYNNSNINIKIGLG